MSIESERRELLKRIKIDSKAGIKDFCKKAKVPYQTTLGLIRGRSLGTIKTWLKIEKYYLKHK